ncbi:hypothetical protein ACJJIF_01470 [Microbulbifer sp. SSSA002]|uniref:hypothetical protein n=1 Tax=Microbulbifer sp. SSSA002 TaxID=3243376 RepID=UPI0040399A42
MKAIKKEKDCIYYGCEKNSDKTIIKKEIDGVFYEFEELSDEDKKIYREEFEKVARFVSQLPTDGQVLTLGSRIFIYTLLGVTIGFVGLACLPVFSDVNITIKLNTAWVSAWAFAAFVFLGLISTPYIMKKEVIPFEGRLFMKVGSCLALLLALFMLPTYAILWGAPVFLHHFTAKDGEITVTVVGKEDNYMNGRCHPRLIIKEFTWLGEDYICPGKEVYKKVNVDSRIILSGKVSEYGVELRKLRWYSDD